MAERAGSRKASGSPPCRGRAHPAEASRGTFSPFVRGMSRAEPIFRSVARFLHFRLLDVDPIRRPSGSPFPAKNPPAAGFEGDRGPGWCEISREESLERGCPPWRKRMERDGYFLKGNQVPTACRRVARQPRGPPGGLPPGSSPSRSPARTLPMSGSPATTSAPLPVRPAPRIRPQ